MMHDAKEVDALIKAGADVNATRLEPRNEYSALIAAAREENLEIVNLLLAAGAKAGFKDDLGRTATDYAKEGKKAEIAELLEAAVKKASPEKK